jgi:DNA invertase Pin-like site-specific DNA recombinase
MAKRANGQTTTRCAIYTRKSSEEGLEQDFNSLDAQRESCDAFILSQKHEGWIGLAEMYDDGGVSGATMERPALKRLLSDIEAERIDTVVVYKVDRLTRSLGDFAKIVEVFDNRGVSFVSVTQAFNTTTSMGRLTLNMLLSFAQFEREVTSERIRDKIAASKKKGMWMGGNVPLGYDVDDRKLVVNEPEAETVRHIYLRYAELGSVRRLKDELDRDGIVSKARVDKYGRPTGGKPLARGALYLMLQNRIYRGEIVHKDKSYPGEHAAIVDHGLWDKVRKMLTSNRIERRTGGSAREPSLLSGLIFDDGGERMTPTHANKKGRRYRYYVTHSLIKRGRPKASDAARRVPAGDIDRLVEERIVSFLQDDGELHGALTEKDSQAREIETLIAEAASLAVRWPHMATVEKRQWLQGLIARVTLNPEGLEIRIRTAYLGEILRRGDEIGANETIALPDQPVLVLTIAARLKRTGIEKKLLIGGTNKPSRTKADAGLLKLIARAHELQEIFTRGGRPISEMAEETGLSSSYFTRMLRLSFLAPDITLAILHGGQPANLNARKLMTDTRAPIDWHEQRAGLGFN